MRGIILLSPRVSVISEVTHSFHESVRTYPYSFGLQSGGWQYCKAVQMEAQRRAGGDVCQHRNHFPVHRGPPSHQRSTKSGLLDVNIIVVQGSGTTQCTADQSVARESVHQQLEPISTIFPSLTVPCSTPTRKVSSSALGQRILQRSA